MGAIAKRLNTMIQEAKKILTEEINQANSTGEEIIMLSTGNEQRCFEKIIEEKRLDLSKFSDNVYEDYDDFYAFYVFYVWWFYFP
jgi:hypothetical protein